MQHNTVSNEKVLYVVEESLKENITAFGAFGSRGLSVQCLSLHELPDQQHY